MTFALLLERWIPTSFDVFVGASIDTAVCLGVAVLCGYIVGLERERRERPAGLRTHILVCVGSAAFVHLGVMALLLIPDGAGLGTIADFNRLIQSIAMGIGFLGAGAIVRGGHHVTGVTTAASIWVMGAVGAAAGAGAIFYALAISAVTYVVLRGLRHAEARANTKGDS